LGLLLSEASFLALTGGILGAILFSAGIYFARNAIIDTMGFPFLFPSWTGLLTVVLLGLAVSSITVLLAALVPVLRISRMEPAEAIRE
jgi:ABC-type antimicrobial peptide transport system permease subunit